MTAPEGYEEIIYNDIKEGDYLKVETTEQEALFERVTKVEGTVSHFSYSHDSAIAKEFNNRYLAHRYATGQKIYRKQPVFEFPTGAGAVVQGTNVNEVVNTLVLCDISGEDADIWRNAVTGTWHTEADIKTVFRNLKVLSEGVEVA